MAKRNDSHKKMLKAALKDADKKVDIYVKKARRLREALSRAQDKVTELRKRYEEANLRVGEGCDRWMALNEKLKRIKH